MYQAFFDFTTNANLYQNRAGSTPVTAVSQRVGRANDPVSGLSLSEVDGDGVRFTWKSDGTYNYAESDGYQYLEDGNHGAWFDTRMNNRDPWWFICAVHLESIPNNDSATLLTKQHASGPYLGAEIAFSRDSTTTSLRTRRQSAGGDIDAVISDASVAQSGIIVVSGGYDGSNSTIRINLDTKVVQADANSLPNTSVYNSAWIGSGGSGSSTTRFYVAAFLDRYPSTLEEEAKIVEIGTLVGLTLGTLESEAVTILSTTASISSSGTSEVKGTSSLSTNATISSDSKVEIKAASTINATSASLASTGSVEVKAASTINATSGSVVSTGSVEVKAAGTLTTSGSVVSGIGTSGVTGTSALPTTASLSSAGIVDVEGAFSVTTDNSTITSSGTIEVLGISTLNVADAVLSSAGELEVKAILSTTVVLVDEHGNILVDENNNELTDEVPYWITQDAAIVASAGVASAEAVATVVTDAILLGEGKAEIQAEVSINTNAAATSEGEVEVQGNLNATTQNSTLSSVATSSVTGSATLSTESNLGGEGSVDVTATSSSEVALLDGNGEPITDEEDNPVYVAIPEIVTADATFFAVATNSTDTTVIIYTDAAVVASSGTSTVEAETLISTDASLMADGITIIPADVTINTDNATVEANGNPNVAASSSLTTDSSTISAEGESTIEAVLNLTTDDALLLASTSTDSYAVATVVTNASLVAAGTVEVVGQANVATANATLTAQAETDVEGSGSITTDNASVESSAQVFVVGEFELGTDDAMVAAGTSTNEPPEYGSAVVNTDDATVVSTGQVEVNAVVLLSTEAAFLSSNSGSTVEGVGVINTGAILQGAGFSESFAVVSLATQANVNAEGEVGVNSEGGIYTQSATVDSEGTVDVTGIVSILTDDAMLFSTGTENYAPVSDIVINTTASVSASARTRHFRERTSNRFVVFDGLDSYSSKPEHVELLRVNVVPTGEVTGGLGTLLPSRTYTEQLVSNLPVSSLNFLNAPWDPLNPEHLDTLVAHSEMFEAATENHKRGTPFGYSLLVPTSENNAISDNQQDRRNYRALNQLPREAGVLRQVNVLTPSFLVGETESPEAWAKRARRSVEECRRVAPNYPVYPYVSFRRSSHPYELVPTAFWRLQLETLRQITDGMILRSFSLDTSWDEEADWWNETQDFLLDRQLVLLD